MAGRTGYGLVGLGHACLLPADSRLVVGPRGRRNGAVGLRHGYLLLGQRLFEEGKEFQGAWNFGPPVDKTYTVAQGAQEIVDAWGEGSIESQPPASFHESTLLQLDSTKAARYLGWRSVLGFSETMQLTAQWYKHQDLTGDASMREYSLRELDAYEERLNGEVTI